MNNSLKQNGTTTPSVPINNKPDKKANKQDEPTTVMNQVESNEANRDDIESSVPSSPQRSPNACLSKLLMVSSSKDPMMSSISSPSIQNPTTEPVNQNNFNK